MVAISLAMLTQSAAAEDKAAADCSDYPFGEGISFPEEGNELKIVSTARADLFTGDESEIQPSMREAQIYATEAIAEFFKTTIQNEDTLNTAMLATSKVSEDKKKTSKMDRLKEQLRSIRTSSSAVLSGVATLGNCYTPGEFVLVTVGVKPETIAAAAELSKSMGATTAGADAPVAPGAEDATAADPQSEIGTDVQPGAGFSNSDAIKKF